MGRKLRHIGLMTLILGVATLGCTRSAVQHKEPPDPLLVTKKPVEGRPRSADGLPAHDAPRPPAPPMHDPAALSVQGEGLDPTHPILLGVEPASGPTGR
jgi:hypothetical protein